MIYECYCYFSPYKTTSVINLRRSSQTHFERNYTTMPFRHSYYAIVVPYDLIEKPAARSDEQNAFLLLLWLLTFSSFVFLRYASLGPSRPSIADMFVDSFSRALSVSVPHCRMESRSENQLSVNCLLANLTLFGMLIGSMCAGVFYEHYTDTNTLVQRIQTTDDLCESDLHLSFQLGTPNEVMEQSRSM